MIRRTLMFLALSALLFSVAGCSKEPENEIVAISQHLIDEQNQAEAEQAAAEEAADTDTLPSYRYMAGNRIAVPEAELPVIVLSRGKGGKAPAETRRYSWYYNDAVVFGDIETNNVLASGIPCSIEKVYVKNLANTTLQNQINTWIDNTVNSFTTDTALPILLEKQVLSPTESRLYIYQSNYCSNGILSISIQMDAYPNITAYSVATFTCDLATGTQLGLGDLFYDDVDYLDYISKSVISQIRSPGFFEVDFSELKRPFSGIKENHAAFAISGSSINIYFPFGNEFFGTGAKVSVPVPYSRYVYSDPSREVKFLGTGISRTRNLIEGTPPALTQFKSVDTINNVNLSSVRFNTGDKTADEELNSIVVSAEASIFSAITLREALSDYLSPEAQVDYRIDVSYLQSTLYGGRLLFLQYQISSIGQSNNYSSIRSICIDTLTRTTLGFEDLIPDSIPWEKKTAVISQNYYNPAAVDPADVISFTLKTDGGITLTMRVDQASLISDESAAKLVIDSSCFDWDAYLSY